MEDDYADRRSGLLLTRAKEIHTFMNAIETSRTLTSS